MAIITKPTIAKGQANEIDLSKSDLAAVSKVVNDSYFSNQANWSKVAMEYESDTGEQIEMLIFDASQESPKANFEVSEKAKDSWQVKSVIIMDFDGGYLKLNRGDLTVENFDIALGSVGGDIGGLVSSPFLLGRPYPFDDNGIFSNSNYTVEVPVGNNDKVDARTDFKTIEAQGKYYAEFIIEKFPSVSGGLSLMMATAGVNHREVDLVTNGGLNNYPRTAVSRLNRGNFTFAEGDISGGYTRATMDLNEGDIVGMAVDIELGVVYFHVNGTWFNNADPSNNTGGYSSGYTAPFPNKVGEYIYLVSKTAVESKITIVKNPQFIPDGYEPV